MKYAVIYRPKGSDHWQFIRDTADNVPLVNVFCHDTIESANKRIVSLELYPDSEYEHAILSGE